MDLQKQSEKDSESLLNYSNSMKMGTRRLSRGDSVTNKVSRERVKDHAERVKDHNQFQYENQPKRSYGLTIDHEDTKSLRSDKVVTAPR
jgi:hypothetical protein